MEYSSKNCYKCIVCHDWCDDSNSATRDVDKYYYDHYGNRVYSERVYYCPDCAANYINEKRSEKISLYITVPMIVTFIGAVISFSIIDDVVDAIFATFCFFLFSFSLAVEIDKYREENRKIRAYFSNPNRSKLDSKKNKDCYCV